LKTYSMTALTAVFLVSGCATYTQQTAKIRNELIRGETGKALEVLENSNIAGSKRDEVLFHMEHGMLQYLQGRYDKASLDWARASRRSDELYTVSISRTLASLAISEDMTDYEGEEHEKIFLPIFSALAFFSASENGKALVEVRRAYEIIKKLKLDEEASTNKIDGFPFLVSALLYEANSNWDAAIIEYRKALKFYAKDRTNSSEGISTLVAESLWRIADYRKRSDVLEFLRETGFKSPNETLLDRSESGEVFVFIESGQSPIKVARDFAINLGSSIINVSFPVYQSISRSSSQTAIYCNGVLCGKTQKSSDVDALASGALDRRRVKEFAKMTARLIMKEKVRETARKQLGEIGGLAVMVANAVTERADTRSWTLLPENIQMTRIKIRASTPVTISLAESGTLPADRVTVQVSPGMKKLVRFRKMF